MNLFEILKYLNNPIDDLSVIRSILSSYDYTDNEWFSDKLFDDFNLSGMQTVTNVSNDNLFRMRFKRWHDLIINEYNSFLKEYNDILKSISFIKDGKEKTVNRLKEITNRLELLKPITVYVDNIYKKQYHENMQTIFASLSPLLKNPKYMSVLKNIPFPKDMGVTKKENALYLKIRKDAFIAFAHILDDKLKNDGVAYTYKYFIDEKGIARVIIYSSNENLEYMINKVNEIIHDYTFNSDDLNLQVDSDLKVNKPTIKEYVYNPPILTSKIGYVGYSVNNEDTISFFKTRTSLLEKAIKDVGKKYLKEDITSVIKLGDKSVSLNNYISIKISQYCLEDFERFLKFQSTSELGYTKKDIDDPLFKKTLYDKIRSRIDNDIDLYINGKEKDISPIMIKTANGKELSIENDMIIEGISSVLPDLISKDVSRIREFQTRIKELSPLLGIDKDNFANNVVNKNKLTELSLQKDKDLDNEKEAFYNEVISNIKVSPLRKRLDSPKGEMSLKDYIITYVYPLFNNRLNNIVNYGTGIFVNGYTFIEKNILEDCQNLYDGNLSIYLKAIDFKFVEKSDQYKKTI